MSVRYSAHAITLAQVVHLFDTAGFACGIGDWRPQKDGVFGMFHVESVDELVKAPSQNGRANGGAEPSV